MPMKKLLFKPGVNQENTRLLNENGWYFCDKVRFRQGTPEKIGGWQQISNNTYQGVARSLWSWSNLSNIDYLGVGTNLKYYIMLGGAYYDITPVRATAALTNPFSTTSGFPTVNVYDVAHGCSDGDFVILTSAATVGGLTISGEYQVTTVDVDNYTITASSNASSTVTQPPGGGGAVTATYLLSGGPAIETPTAGWGAGPWGAGAWGIGESSTLNMRIWNHQNFGEDLLYGTKNGAIYYWDASFGITNNTVTISVASPAVVTAPLAVSNGTAISFYTLGAMPTGLSPGVEYYVVNSAGTTFSLAATPGGTAINTTGAGSGTISISVRGQPLTSLVGASDVPQSASLFLVSDTSRIVLAFGCPDYGSSQIDYMLIRWSDQESAVNWTPAATNQAGSVRLSHGSQIVAVTQVRQEILVWTDTSLYSLQYLGPPVVWSSQLLADNISIINDRAAVTAAGGTYWMANEKFYVYDGRVNALDCDLRQHVFSNFNFDQSDQVFAATNQQFNEIWWFYCSANSTVVDSYVVYNYLEKIWYYGAMGRTTWIDSSIVINVPIAATYSNNLVYHETGVDDATTASPVPIEAYITSAEFDIDDGDRYGFVWRVLPDMTFRGSTVANPVANLTLLPLQNSGSGYNNPLSEGGTNTGAVVRSATVPVEQYTQQVNIRVRGRQIALKLSSDSLGVQWQAGATRLDIRSDGRAGTR